MKRYIGAAGLAAILLGFAVQSSAPPHVIEAGAVLLWVAGGLALLFKLGERLLAPPQPESAENPTE